MTHLSRTSHDTAGMIILIQTPHPSPVILFLNPIFVPSPSPAQLITCYTHLLHTDMQYIIHSNYDRTPHHNYPKLMSYTPFVVYTSNDSTVTLSPQPQPYLISIPAAHKLHPQLTPLMRFLIPAKIRSIWYG